MYLNHFIEKNYILSSWTLRERHGVIVKHLLLHLSAVTNHVSTTFVYDAMLIAVLSQQTLSMPRLCAMTRVMATLCDKLSAQMFYCGRGVCHKQWK